MRDHAIDDTVSSKPNLSSDTQPINNFFTLWNQHGFLVPQISAFGVIGYIQN